MKSLPKAILWLPAALLLAIYGPAPARAAADLVNLKVASQRQSAAPVGDSAHPSNSLDRTPSAKRASRAATSAYLKELGLPVW